MITTVSTCLEHGLFLSTVYSLLTIFYIEKYIRGHGLLGESFTGIVCTRKGVLRNQGITMLGQR